MMSRIKSRDEIVEDLVDRELAPPVQGGTNHDVYARRLLSTGHSDFKYEPRCIYFYYVRIDEDGRVRIDNYFYPNGPRKNPSRWRPIAYDDVPKILKKLAINGRPRKNKKPRPSFGDTFEDVVWNRRAYIGIFFDEANWAFHRRSNGKAAVVCNVTSGAKPNGSFFDAQDLTFMMKNKKTGRKDKRSAIFFINHMKYENKGQDCDIGDMELSYKFDFYMRVRYSKTDYSVMTVVLDPGGTNQGPPQQP
jgi:hypothetical protein